MIYLAWISSICLIFGGFLFKMVSVIVELFATLEWGHEVSKSSFTFKSFQDLKALLENKPFSFPERHPVDLTDPKEELLPELEEDLFKKAMEGVRPSQG